MTALSYGRFRVKVDVFHAELLTGNGPCRHPLTVVLHLVLCFNSGICDFACIYLSHLLFTQDLCVFFFLITSKMGSARKIIL